MKRPETTYLLLEHSESEVIINPPAKINPLEKLIELKYNPEMLKEKKYYKVENDPDYINSNGDRLQFMIKKRIQAETNIIKFIIMTKVLNGDTLTRYETKYLNLWTQNISGNSTSSILPGSYSKQKMGSISSNDLEILENQFEFTYDSSFNNFSLNEIFFEVSEMLNKDLIKQFEASLKAKIFEKHWNISPVYGSLVSSGLNNHKRFLLDKAEAQMWNNNFAYSKEDEEAIIGLFSLGRGLTKADQVFLEKDQESLRTYIKSINKNENRHKMLLQCIHFHFFLIFRS